jgi:hypothetical protein
MNKLIPSAKPATETLNGELRLVFDEMYNDCRTICLLVDGETVIMDGRPAYRAVTLNRTLTEKFNAAYFNTIFIGDAISIEVRTTDLQQDLANGKGLRGKKSYFIGLGMSYYE